MNGTRPAVPSWTKYLVYLSLLVMFCLGVRTISTAETWVHLASGRWIAGNGVPHQDALSFTRAGEAWVDTTWLYDLLVYAGFRVGGVPLLVLVHAALAVAAFLFLLPAAKRWAGPVSISLGLLLSAWLLAPRFEVRPTIAGLLFAAVFIATFIRHGGRWIAWLILLPMQVVWTNLHDSFLLGPFIGLVFAAQAFAAGRRSAELEDAEETPASGAIVPALLAAALLAATLLNPYGIKLHAAVAHAWYDPAVLYTREWISPFTHLFPPSVNSLFVVLALVIGAAGLITEKRKLPVAFTALAVAAAFAVVLKPDSLLLDYLALLAFPFFCLSLGSLGELAENRLPRLFPVRKEALPAAGGIVTAVLALASLGGVVTNAYYLREGSASSFGLGAVTDLFPESARHVIQREDFPAQAVNLIGDGGFLLWQYPDRKVFADQRATVYGDEFYRVLYNGLLRGEPASLDAILQKWQPEAFIINACAPKAGIAIRNLLMGAQCALVYFDGTTAVFVQADSQHAQLIGDRELQEAGLQVLDKALADYRARAGGLFRPAIPARLIGAGTMFLTLNRYREAAAVYSTLTRGAPSMTGAWLSLGICQRELGATDEAVTSLSEALRQLPRKQRNLRARACVELSRAYAQLGRTQEAQAAFDEGQELDSALAEALGNPLSK